MRIGIVQVSHELLVEALKLPKGSVVMDARPDWNLGQFQFRIVSEELPEVPPGAAIRVYTPEIWVDSKDCGCREYRWEWNI